MSVIAACDFLGTRLNSFVKDLRGGGQDQMNYLLSANYLGALCTLDQEKSQSLTFVHMQSQTKHGFATVCWQEALLGPQRCTEIHRKLVHLSPHTEQLKTG